MTADPAPLTPQQSIVDVVCTAFGWDYRMKAGHAAGWASRTRKKLGLGVAEFVTEFVTHYGRIDPGAGTWWVYRQVYPCDKLGKFPTPAIVDNSWGQWDLPVAVTIVARSKYADALDFLVQLEANDGKQG